MQNSTHNRYLITLFWLACLLLTTSQLAAQCSSPIAVFPYTEGFEASNGNWASGGTASSWAWGSPSKPVINSAGSGSRCWVTGGLNGSSYNDEEFSWLQSPCFDFSSLTNPEISFRVFWETELQFDGASLQYSTNEGNTWTVLGSEASNSNCAGINWYNFNSVQFIGFTPGWSGNVQTGGGNCRNGQGSGQWLTARHTVAMLAGQPKVLFRFVFGSGRICNSFDGFAIDDVQINEAPPNTASFTYQCGAVRAVNFTTTASGCAAAYSWNFGDLASGTANTSTSANPSHTFSAPGQYTVSLTVSFLVGPQVQITDQIRVFEARADITGQIRCNGDQTGAASVITDPPAGTYTYTWNTNPVQSGSSINSVPAGNYTVTISSPNACNVQLPVNLPEPDALQIGTSITDAKCGRENGEIISTVTGGVEPYNYQWSNAEITAAISNLDAGTYKLSVSDANGCVQETADLVLSNINNTINISLGANQSICPGQTITLNPGNFASYLWQDNTTSQTFTVRQTGTYQVTVTDADGCQASASVEVKVDCREVYFPTAFTPGSDGLNDGFGPLGDIGSLRNYVLEIYGRWGQLIYTSVDPNEKWKGLFKGQPVDLQTCVWIARFSRAGKQQTRKGYVTIIR